MMHPDWRYMRRALQLARKGEGFTSPNPMVGAVIVDSAGQIIGEGYHRRWGEGHAEVNAVASVKDESALVDSTIYVTLEPCSHYGKTPPCAQLIIDKRIPRVVVGCLDPFEKVSGRGVKMLRDAGVEVVVADADGEIARECRALNRKFITAHTLRRPFVTLKWAQSADGYMDAERAPGEGAYRFSTPLSTVEVHRLRSLHDAILVGSGTMIADSPRLNVRLWHGRDPQRVVLDRSGRIQADDNTIVLDSPDIASALAELYRRGITSVLVEGGAAVLKSFIDEGLWDEARVEIAPVILGSRGRAKAPILPLKPSSATHLRPNQILHYSHGH